MGQLNLSITNAPDNPLTGLAGLYFEPGTPNPLLYIILEDGTKYPVSPTAEILAGPGLSFNVDNKIKLGDGESVSFTPKSGAEGFYDAFLSIDGAFSSFYQDPLFYSEIFHVKNDGVNPEVRTWMGGYYNNFAYAHYIIGETSTNKSELTLYTNGNNGVGTYNGAYIDFDSNVTRSFLSFWAEDINIGIQQITLRTDGVMLVTDSVLNTGFVYDADYSANFVARSIVDKAYVDAAIIDGDPYADYFTFTPGTPLYQMGFADDFYQFLSGAHSWAIDGAVRFSFDRVNGIIFNPANSREQFQVGQGAVYFASATPSLETGGAIGLDTSVIELYGATDGYFVLNSLFFRVGRTDLYQFGFESDEWRFEIGEDKGFTLGMQTSEGQEVVALEPIDSVNTDAFLVSKPLYRNSALAGNEFTTKGELNGQILPLENQLEAIQIDIVDIKDQQFNEGLLIEHENDLFGRGFEFERKINVVYERLDISQNLQLIPSATKSAAIATQLPLNDNRSEFIFASGANGRVFNRFGINVPVAANRPRLSYDPYTKQWKGLTIEPELTNQVTYSDAPTNAAWQSGTTALTISATTIPSPVQGQFLTELRETTATAAHRLRQPFNANKFTTNRAWIYFYVRKETDPALSRNIGFRGLVTNYSIGLFFNPITGLVERENYPQNIQSLIIPVKYGNEEGWIVAQLTDTSLVDKSGATSINMELYLRIGTSATNYAGSTDRRLFVGMLGIIPVPDGYNRFPDHIFTEASVVTKSADIATLPDWVEKGYMGSYSGTVIESFGNGDIIRKEYEDGELTVITNGTAASPITEAIPNDYILPWGDIKSIKIKKLLDGAPTAPAVFDTTTIIGWAAAYNSGAGVTGGGAATPIVVTNEAEFRSAIEASSATPSVIHFSVNITLSTRTYQCKGNLTLHSPNGSTLFGGELRWQGATKSNVILSNFVRREKSGDPTNDLLAIETDAQGFFLNHLVVDGDTNFVIDGLWDMKKGVNYITASFCWFRNHKRAADSGLPTGEGKTSLIGLNPDQVSQLTPIDWNPIDETRNKVSLLFNRYTELGQRVHSVVFGKIHQYGCLYDDVWRAWQIKHLAKVRVEKTVFKNINRLNEEQDLNGNFRFTECIISNIGLSATIRLDSGAGMDWEPADDIEYPYSELPEIEEGAVEAYVINNAGILIV